MREIFWLAEELIAFQEWLCSLKFVSIRCTTFALPRQHVFQTHFLISNVTEAWEDSGNVEEWHMASALYRGPYVFKVFTEADHIINNDILDTSYSMNCSTILYMFVYWACSHSRTKRLLTSSCPSVRIISAAPTGRISVKFDIGFYENLSRN